jgi:hypothetical protein
MHIGMRIQLANRAKGWHTPPGRRTKRPTEPLLSAQPDPHRPTGACNPTHIIANQHTQPAMDGVQRLD